MTSTTDPNNTTIASSFLDVRSSSNIKLSLTKTISNSPTESGTPERFAKILANSPRNSNYDTSITATSNSINGLSNYFKDPKNTKHLIKWSNLDKIFTILKAYGDPTVIISTNSYIIVGTIKGMVLIFDFNELLQNILIPQLSSTVANNANINTATTTTVNTNSIDYLRQSVDTIKISSDGTYIAASYTSGDIFIWNLNSTPLNLSSIINSNPNFIITNNQPSNTNCLLPAMHINYHTGNLVKNFFFINSRHTAVVVLDLTLNKLVYHNGHRDSLWNLIYNSKTLLDLMDTKLLNCEYTNNSMIAILTNKSFMIYKMLAPDFQCIYHEPIQLGYEQITNSGINWSNDNTNLIFSINNNYTCLTINSIDDTISAKSTHVVPELILSLKWISPDLISILTISHQFLIIETINFNVILNLDLLVYEILIPPNKFLTYNNFKNQLLILTNYNLKFGKFISWSDLILTNVQRGNYFDALNFLKIFLNDFFPLANLINLNFDAYERIYQLKLPFLNLSLAAIKFVLKKFATQSDLENFSIDENDFHMKLHELLDMILNILLLNYKDFQEDTNSFIEQIITYLFEFDSQHPSNNATLPILYELLLEIISIQNKSVPGTLTNIKLVDPDESTQYFMDFSPIIIKNLQIYTTEIKKDPIAFKNLIISLNLNNNSNILDIDFAVNYCKQEHLFDLLIFIWNRIFMDYSTPLIDFFYLINDQTKTTHLFNELDLVDIKNNKSTLIHMENLKLTIYDYIGFILTSRQYPISDVAISLPVNQMNEIKLKFYNIIFSGTSIKWPNDSSEYLMFEENSSLVPAFPYLSLLFNYDSKRFLSLLNEVFEDSFFSEDISNDAVSSNYNLNINRQYIIDTLIDYSKQVHNSIKRDLITIFIAKNYPKYPQFINLSNHTLDNLIQNLCSTKYIDTENTANSNNLDNEILLEHERMTSLESLLTVYIPNDIEKLIILLKSKNYYLVLFKLYSKVRKFDDLLELALSVDDCKKIFGKELDTILTYIWNNVSSSLSTAQYADSVDNIKDDADENFLQLMKIKQLLKENFKNIVLSTSAEYSATINNQFDSSLHKSIIKIFDSGDMDDNKRVIQQKYLEKVFQINPDFIHSNNDLQKLYVDLSCRLKASNQKVLLNWLNNLSLKNLESNHLVNILNISKNFEALALIHTRVGKFDLVVDDIVHCIETWFLKDKCDRAYNDLNKFLKIAIKSINQLKNLDDNNEVIVCENNITKDVTPLDANRNRNMYWIKLIVTLIKIYGNSSDKNLNRDDCNRALQFLFVGVAMKECNDINDFWGIMAGVLEQQDIIMMKVNTLKDLFGDIFTSYELEKHISSLLLKIIDESSIELINEYKARLVEGWSILNDRCDICNKKIWGVGLNSSLFLLWEENELSHNSQSYISDECLKAKFNNEKLIVFKCHHGFHANCLRNLGQKGSAYSCLTCNKT
ncbi:hypothetical protein TBLA_0E01300 [Henningerozyma blattae CBS 6284]|uniref:Vacuolar protein sorting-associated protein 8 central domain-containing protein n=1 Tax=Henningerozyma blattae (strain ATCC 34711 / CBS 6284 / DSM 70876 / NBRC 10599 / NRRL Y-10934 / UCD 77-7) TaxID=1071380 RepID=I2H488_HENB6|nr:hypothetical protein TBLA_0E01300 [Tetrapisispora blattae CBS 6284]CCH61190.1 hypothetical protein TBLA_0E01300 [Tetrapisispora blattae CBS 6284]